MNSSLYTQADINNYLHEKIWDLTSLRTICEKNSSLFPAREAVVDSRSRLTWADVKQKSDRLAVGLLHLGFTRDDIVITQLYNSVEQFLLIVACQKAGIILAIVAPNFRESSLDPILKHIKPKGAIIPGEFRGHDFYRMYTAMKTQLPDLQKIIVLGDDVPAEAVSLKDLLGTEITDGDIRNLTKYSIQPYEVSGIGTSGGTTGVPKLNEHIESSRIVGAKNLIDRWEIKESDTVGVFYNLPGGTLSRVALLSAPMVGAKIILSEHFSPESFCQIVAKERVTIACIVPTEMVRILDYPGLDQYDMSSLRLLANSTDVLPYELGVRAEEKFKCPYAHTYGATDAGGICSSSIQDSREVRLRTVGRPYDHVVIKIVDDHGNPVPGGEVGEVMVHRNPSSASGYFNNPEMNNSLWKNGWFSLGETGRLDKDGNLILVSRKRNVIKRGGQRIAPKDVEELIMRHPDVRLVAAVAMPDAEMGQKVCAYIVPKPNKRIALAEIVAFLKSQKVTPFLIPERVELLDEMPLVAVGQKIDRRWLEQDVANKVRQQAVSRT